MDCPICGRETYLTYDAAYDLEDYWYKELRFQCYHCGALLQLLEFYDEEDGAPYTFVMYIDDGERVYLALPGR